MNIALLYLFLMSASSVITEFMYVSSVLFCGRYRDVMTKLFCFVKSTLTVMSSDILLLCISDVIRSVSVAMSTPPWLSVVRSLRRTSYVGGKISEECIDGFVHVSFPRMMSGSVECNKTASSCVLFLIFWKLIVSILIFRRFLSLCLLFLFFGLCCLGEDVAVGLPKLLMLMSDTLCNDEFVEFVSSPENLLDSDIDVLYTVVL